MSDFRLGERNANVGLLLSNLNPSLLSRIKQPNTKDLYLDAIAMVFADFDRDCTVFLYPKIPYFTKTTTLFAGRPRRTSRHGPEPGAARRAFQQRTAALSYRGIASYYTSSACQPIDPAGEVSRKRKW